MAKYSGKCAWHKNAKLISKYAHVHITKADFRMESGYMQWIRPPRIGIDFRKNLKRRGQLYIANIDVGELVRFSKILKILETNKKVMKSLVNRERGNFVIFQTPEEIERRVRFIISGDEFEIQHWRQDWNYYKLMASMKHNQIPRLRKIVNEALEAYLKLIERWISTGKLPKRFRNCIKDKKKIKVPTCQ